jgi:hypothetical protein
MDAWEVRRAVPVSAAVRMAGEDADGGAAPRKEKPESGAMAPGRARASEIAASEPPASARTVNRLMVRLLWGEGGVPSRPRGDTMEE